MPDQIGRQQSSTAYPITFLLVLSVDHTTGATGKTPTVTLAKNGAASFGAASGAVTEMGNGKYALAGHATDRNTLGPLDIHVAATGCDPLDFTVPIITVDPFAAQYGLTNLDAAVSSRSTYAGGAVASVTGNVGGNVTGSVGSVLGNVAGNVTGSVGSVLGNVAGSVASVVGNVGGNVVGSVGSVLGNVAGSVANLLDISAAALARFFTRDSGSTYGASVAGSVVKEIADNASSDPTTIADAVLDALAADHDDPGTIGAKINDIGAVTDPWATDLGAGGYTAGEAGAIVLGIEAQTALFGTTSLTMNAPQFNSLNYPLVAGRTYKQQYGNALQFVLANTSIDLTDPGISFAVNLRVNSTNATFPGTAVTTQTGYFEIPGDDTADWVTDANTDGVRFYGEIVVYSGADPDPIDAIDITPGFLKVVPGVNNS